MQDDPPATLLIAEARTALEAGLTAGFPQKVAANALGIAQRGLELGPVSQAAECERLEALLGYAGEVSELNRALAVAVSECTIALDADNLLRHLVLTTLAKLAIDQPGYPGYRALAGGGATTSRSAP